MSDRSEPQIVTPPQYVRLGAVLIALETSKSLREATRAIHDLKTESFPAEEIARLRAEVERLTRERDEAHAILADAAAAFEAKDTERVRLDLCDRYARSRAFALNSARENERRVCREDVEINARRAESAEARVAELEAWGRKWHHVGCFRGIALGCANDPGIGPESMCMGCDLRAILSPKPAPLPDLTFDADDPLPDMTPAPIPEPKCWHCSYIGEAVRVYCGRSDCGEKPAPCGTCDDSGSGGAPCGDCGAGEDCPDCRGEEKK